MTDSPPKRRAWFQLHLSTCVVLMVVAGVFVGLNVHLRSTAHRNYEVGRKSAKDGVLEVIVVEHCEIGWPQVYRRYYRVEGRVEQAWTVNGSTNVDAIMTNAATGLFGLFVLSVVFEACVARRHERKRLEVKP